MGICIISSWIAAKRAAYFGKVSRVQFFWGSADLNVTRFSGQPCEPPPAAGFLDRVFNGAADELVQSLLRAERIPPDELERLQALIADARRNTKSR